MAGHSKWANIKHRKGSQDAKKGKIFTKIIKEITVAARLSGADKESNPRLRKAIQHARENNVPQDNIIRAVKKGAGELEGIKYEEMLYEGHGPLGIAILIEAITDNKNRTVSELRHILNKNDGSLSEPGSVAWMFDRKGEIIIKSKIINEEKFFDDIVELGAEDFEKYEEKYLVHTNQSNFYQVKDGLEKKKYNISSSDLIMAPKTLKYINKNDSSKVILLIEALDNHDDVKEIYSNHFIK